MSKATKNYPTKRIAKKISATTPDLIFENHFSLFLIRPVSPLGSSWLDENVVTEGTVLILGGAVPCEPRYVEAIAKGAAQDGLVVSL